MNLLINENTLLEYLPHLKSNISNFEFIISKLEISSKSSISLYNLKMELEELNRHSKNLLTKDTYNIIYNTYYAIEKFKYNEENLICAF